MKSKHSLNEEIDKAMRVLGVPEEERTLFVYNLLAYTKKRKQARREAKEYFDNLLAKNRQKREEQERLEVEKLFADLLAKSGL